MSDTNQDTKHLAAINKLKARVTYIEEKNKQVPNGLEMIRVLREQITAVQMNEPPHILPEVMKDRQQTYHKIHLLLDELKKETEVKVAKFDEYMKRKHGYVSPKTS